MSDTKPRPMSLGTQAAVLRHVADQWVKPAEGSRMIGSPVYLRQEDVDDLRTIAKTLDLMAHYGADGYVRAQADKAKKARAGVPR